MTPRTRPLPATFADLVKGSKLENALRRARRDQRKPRRTR
jgi:hypothetical protein